MLNMPKVVCFKLFMYKAIFIKFNFSNSGSDNYKKSALIWISLMEGEIE